MIKVILHGAAGKMGHVLGKKIKESAKFCVVAGVDKNGVTADGGTQDSSLGFPLYDSLEDCKEEADLVIDFSHHSGVKRLLEYSVSRGLPVVIATTALDDGHMELMAKAAETIPVFHSFNMSLGINVVSKMVQDAMPFLEEDFNTEIIEKHHKMKLDSPSGTALLLADSINAGCQTKKEYLYGRHGKADACAMTDLGIHAVRGGTICGEHTVIFAGPDEVIEITHRALSRDIFATGALKAAAFLMGQEPGLYSMDELLRS